MNKKILLSFVTIGVVLASVGGATRALFSDEETSTGNTFTTGTIDIAVDGENPWEAENKFALEDMKPSYTDYIDFVIYNEGNNPANVWKYLEDFVMMDDEISEPECVYDGDGANPGVWSDNGCSDGYESKDDIDTAINYDLRVELYDENPENTGAEPVWWENIYLDSDNFTLDYLEDEGMYLGMIPVGWYMKVKQSYHMVSTTENWAQGDKLDFDIRLKAEQLTNKVELVRKDDANTDVSHHIWDGDRAGFSYKVMDRVLDWTLNTTDVPNGDYTLLVWDDTANDYAWDWGTRSDAIVLGHITVSGNDLYEPDEPLELNRHLINAKVWLVPGIHGDVGGSAKEFSWGSAENAYFETGLIDYYDADVPMPTP